MKGMECSCCEYAWQSRVAQPKACPRCKTRLDYARKRTVDIRDLLEEAAQ